MPTKGEIKIQLDKGPALVESIKQELGQITKEKDELALKRGVMRDG